MTLAIPNEIPRICLGVDAWPKGMIAFRVSHSSTKTAGNDVENVLRSMSLVRGLQILINNVFDCERFRGRDGHIAVPSAVNVRFSIAARSELFRHMRKPNDSIWVITRNEVEEL